MESNKGLEELHSMGRFRALAANIRLGLKSPKVAKILACYSDEFLQKDYLSALDRVFSDNSFQIYKILQLFTKHNYLKHKHVYKKQKTHVHISTQTLKLLKMSSSLKLGLD